MNDDTVTKPTLGRGPRLWLLICAAAIFCMVVIGGVTRLTGSGLSMTDWHLIHGVIPPLNNEQWFEEFANYQQSPEYQKINKGMSLSEFKQIFFWEYIHRIWGRLLGFLFAIPMLWFFIRNKIPQNYILPILGLFVLGGMQGLIGWWMVKSGLIDRPEVSHYRLTVHLSMAFILFSACLWMGIKPTHYKPPGTVWLFLFLYCITGIIGAFVAGLKAGLIYNQFPLMGNSLVPAEMWYFKPAWRNFLVNEATIQFTHRWLAVTTWLVALFIYYRYRSVLTGRLLGFTTLQVFLGIFTLLYGVPVILGVLHQANAVLVLGAAIMLIRGAGYKDAA